MREKIIEVIRCVLNNLPWGEITLHTAEDIADRLMSNGFGFLDDRPRFLLARSQTSGENLQQILDGGPVILDAGEVSIIPIYPNQWISVKDRLPEIGQRVLVYCESKTIEKHITVCTYTGGYLGSKQWSRHVRRVTHWMPLPEPPKGE